jgi:putative transposase
MPTATAPFADATAPNEVWCIDFKGKFKTGDGVWCTPFTVTDAFSRFCIRCEIVEQADTVSVEHILDSAFREFGLPAAMRSDNGPPFAAPGPAGLTRLAVWLLRLGIRLERIEPGKPQQNGRHERFHRTLEQEAARPPKLNAALQQRAFDLFRREYNEERPHEALGQKPPAHVYTPSSRRYPGALITISPSPIFHSEQVDRNGTIRWARRRVFVSTALYGETVEIAPDEGERWTVQFGAILLGAIDPRRPERLLPAPRPRKTNYLELVPREI